MTTWADIKLAALKKMDPSIKSLTVQNSTRDYLNSIVPAANRGLQDLATAGKFIIKEYDIMTCDVTNLLGQDFTTRQHLNDDIEFASEYGQAYYFEISGRAKVDIYVGETLARTVETEPQAGFKTFKGKLINEERKPVRIVFSGPYPYQLRNAAVFDVLFETDEDVWEWTTKRRYKLKELAKDFFKLVPSDMVLESKDTAYTKYKDYEWENDDTLILDGTKQGHYKVHYYAYAPVITIDTPDDMELALDPEVANLLPVYIASELYEDDDLSTAYYFRQQYDEAKQRLVPSGAKGKAEFKDVWGWS